MRVQGAASNYQTVSAIHLVSRISRNWGIFVAVKIPLGLLVKRIYRQLNAITPPHRGFIGQCIIIMIVMIFWAHQYKAAGRKTRLDIQNYGCSGNLLCYHGVVERNRISFAEPWKGVGKGMFSPGCLLWQWWYACQSLVWAQWPSHAMYQLFLWQVGRRCVCVLANLEYLSVITINIFNTPCSIDLRGLQTKNN